MMILSEIIVEAWLISIPIFTLVQKMLCSCYSKFFYALNDVWLDENFPYFPSLLFGGKQKGHSHVVVVVWPRFACFPLPDIDQVHRSVP